MSTSPTTALTTSNQVQSAPQADNRMQVSPSGPILDKLSYELIHHILSFLCPKDFRPLLLTCKYTYINILADNFLWKKLLRNHFPSTSLEGVTNFVGLYKNLDAGPKNIRQKNYKKTTVKHKGALPGSWWSAPTVSAHSGLLASRSDSSIIIWKNNNNDIKPFRYIPGTESLINDNVLLHENICFYSRKNGVTAYDIKDGKELYTITFPPPHGTSLLPHVARDGYLCAATDKDWANVDNHVKVFEIEGGKEIYTTEGPYQINGVEMSGQNIFLSLKASTWDEFKPESNYLIQTIDFVNKKEINRFHTKGFIPGAMAANANNVFCANVAGFCAESSIVILDTKSGEMQRIIKTALPTIYNIFALDRTLLINARKEIILLNLENEETAEIIADAYQKANYDEKKVAMSNYKIYWGSNKDGQIDVFDFSPSNTEQDKKKKS